MDNSIKKEIHDLVDKCTDEQLLNETKELLSTTGDWFDELSEEDKNLKGIRISIWQGRVYQPPRVNATV